MSKSFEMNEFFTNDEVTAPPLENIDQDVSVKEEIPEIDVQKAVVEELATEKEELHEQKNELEKEFINLKQEVAELKLANNELIKKLDTLTAALSTEHDENIAAKHRMAMLENELARANEKELDLQERNPNALALLDRDIDLPDRFPGESRDHILEVLREARDLAESQGRRRRAQLLEAVLVANEPNGNLAKKREELTKVFNQNANVITGEVIKELSARGISHKEGEEYLLPSEIMLRNF